MGHNGKWDNHIYQLATKLSSVCYVIRSLRAVVSKNTLKIIYFSYVHSIITYGIIFWGNTLNGIKIFKIKEKRERGL
jgi:predicted transcriptional regulator with HTH domain